VKNKLLQVALLPRRTSDLAAVTDGYSGADLAGLVRCAGSIALERTRQLLGTRGIRR
jgi:SpoVK/Ycf46/Vps4 family AAA+-type ATPase